MSVWGDFQQAFTRATLSFDTAWREVLTSPSTLELTLIFLFVAVAVVIVFKRLRLPAMLGYLVAGILIGPNALGWVPDTAETRHLAEFGVVFLMFSIGLEFSLTKLHAMRRAVFGLGFAQVGLTLLFSILGGLLVYGLASAALRSLMPDTPGAMIVAMLILGGALAMSSTAIVVKMMAERVELDSPHGRQVMGILLFQDLAVVPLLIVIPALAQPAGELVWTLTAAALKAALVLATMLFFGQRIMARWLTLVAQSKSRELFVLNVLLLTLGLAWLTEASGLSLALGAFLAGVLIAETQYRYQVEEDIKSFRDVLLGLFFVTTGMLLDPAVFVAQWWLVLVLVLVPMAFKFGLIAFLARLFGASAGTAMRTGLYLAQAGEFAFVLLAPARELGLLPSAWLQPITCAMLLSMLSAPFLIHYADRLVLRFSRQEWLQKSLELHRVAQRSVATDRHVLICGYGRSGQHLARLLERESMAYVALDLDPDRIREAAAGGDSVVFGDAARRDTLIAAGLSRAACVVVSFADTKSAEKVLASVRAVAPAVPVIVRTHDEADLERLMAAGASEVVPEILEGSLMLGSQALMYLGVPLSRVVQQIRSVRESRYQIFRGVFRGLDDETDTPEHQWVRLHTVELTPGAVSIGQQLGDLGLAVLGVSVAAVRRRGIRGGDPSDELKLMQNDILVLRGQPESLVSAEKKLIGG